MRLSDVTLKILTNFASINQGLIFKPGNELTTMSVMKNIFAVATIEEAIPVEFAIYDLNELLDLYFTFTRFEKQISVSHPKGSLNEITQLEETAEEGINFMKEYLFLKSGETTLRYFYNSPSIVISPGDKRIMMKDVDNKFVLPVSILNQIWKYQFKLKVKDLTSTEAGFKIWNRAKKGNQIEFNFDYQMKGGEFILKIENLKLLPLDYDVEINSKGIAHFISRSPAYKVEYFVALETPSDEDKM